MKSLALHLIAILLLGTVHTPAHQNCPLLTAAASTSVSTTTPRPPSLPAPHQSLPLTIIATSTPITAAASASATTSVPSATRRQQQPTARRTLAHANSMANLAAAEAATFTSTKLVRNADAASANSVRQNRSLQSALANEPRSGDSSGNTNGNSDSNMYKSRRSERRHHFRTNQSSSNSANATSDAAVSTTPSPTRSSATTTATVAATAATHSSSSKSAQPTQRTVSTAFKASQRQSVPSVVLLDGDVPTEQARHANYSAKLQETPKTSRMIQRLVAGHIQNAEGHSTYQVSAVSTNSSVSNSASPLNPTPLYFRRKQPMLSSSYRHDKASAAGHSRITPITTTSSKPSGIESIIDMGENYDSHDDDEALLDDPGDFDNWDNGILRLSAGSGKENSAKSKKSKEDSKKTLSEQVRDGKYGLIEKELFRREPKRPGVLSYLPNKEVPYDNERNYGGLPEEDIWLAEDHLLVIKGGSLNTGEAQEPWPPIDDYDAPGRQIKIPPHPKVPPPFPVQLEENGPVQFIGNSKFTVVYPVANESIPVYPAGQEAKYTPPESDSDNEKNLLTRPGSSPSPAEGEPGYLYPAPYPPWLYHNQTFVNPFLKNARPITFPGLGPFPFGRNGSLDNSNSTDKDYFDEDDPSLYYPPAYSFVYKNNYTNPVPPGPLVPGIVLPPPANQFSRLQKPDKTYTTSPSPPVRHRLYTTTSTTTTTTTTTSKPPPEIPFRQVITKISEYTPKTIIITPAPPVVSTSIPPTQITKLPPSPPSSPSSSLSSPIEPVPVPVAVPIPVYPSQSFPPSRQSLVDFIPTTPEPTRDTLSKSNPIYYEYFEAKRQPTTPNIIDNILSTTAKPPASPKPIKLYATSKRPLKSQGHRNYLQPIPPNRQFVKENIVYITPKPEIRYKPLQQVPVFKPRPLENFEREVNALRETLRYYQNQQLRDNNIPRTPKAKPIYEYSFDSTKNLQPTQSITAAGSFQPPAEYDEQPFKPMVTYSPPVGDENSFRAIAYDKADNEIPTAQQQQEEEEQVRPQPKYQSTTTLVPVQPDAQYPTQKSRTKKTRIGAKYLQQPLTTAYQPQQQHQQQQQPPTSDASEYQSTQRTVLTTQPPWISLDKQELNEYAQPAPRQPVYSERLQVAAPIIAPKNRVFAGYYYGPPPPSRQNHRFYDEPFHNPVRKIINYRPPPQFPQPQQQQQQQQQPVWSLENDTYVNYAPNRPPLNPDAEFINPFHTISVQPYAQQGQRVPVPALSHQSQYYAPPHRLPPQAPPLRQPQQQQIPLHRDILVNYRQPLPPINPDSEYVPQAQLVRHNSANQIYRSNAYRVPQAPRYPTNGGEQSNIYYITPKYRNVHGNGGSDNNGK